MLTRSSLFLFAFVISSSLVFLRPVNVKAGVNMQSVNANGRVIKRNAYFEKNIGQTNSEILYQYASAGYKLKLHSNDAEIAISKPRINRSNLDEQTPYNNNESQEKTSIRLQFLGANKTPKIKGVGELKSRSNYFIGNKQETWIRNAPHYDNVVYEDIYPDIDLVFYTNETDLEYDFILKKETDPGKIKFTFKGVDRIFIDSAGDLILTLGVKEFRLHRPKMYQIIGGQRIDVNGNYILHDKVIGFQVAAYDRTAPLVIDPVLSYSTYLGGTGYDDGSKIAVDANKNVYVVGATDAFSTDGYTKDIIVAKFDAGGQLVYLSYMGGAYDEIGNGIYADSSGNVYVAGTTSSDDFPTTPGVIQPSCLSHTYAKCGDSGFVAKISSTGSELLYSTFVSGGPQDSSTVSYTGVSGIAIDPFGNAYIAGYTQSPTFPVTNKAFQTTYRWSGDAFIAKLNNNATQFLYATYLGGSGVDEANAIAIDADGNVYVGGKTSSPNSMADNDFPVMNALYPVQKGLSDGFVAKLNPSGTNLVFSTYLGGSNQVDSILGLAIDYQRNIIVTGQTKSADWPGTQNPNPWVETTGDGFITKLNSTGDAILYSLYLGGQYFDYGTDVVTDAAGNAYLTGTTNSPDFPVTENAFQKIQPGNDDIFISKIGPDGVILYSTFLGGFTNDIARGIAVGSSSDVYITGAATSTDFPVANAVQTSNSGFYDAVITKLDLAAPVNELSITKLGDETYHYFTITSDPPGIICNQYCTPINPYTNAGLSCKDYCSHYFDAGTLVQLIITPDPASFPDWIYTLSGTATGSVTMDQARNVTVKFTRNPQKLTVAMIGTGGGAIKGGGTVTSVPAGISCLTGSCVSFFERDSSVKLFPTSDINSIFSGWAGACTNVSGDCTITMNVDRSASAAFNFIQPVRNVGPPEAYFDHISLAYAALSGSGTIQTREYEFTGNLLLNKGYALIIKGGYNLTYESNPGYTTLLGILTIDSGSLKVQRLIIK